jgi:hypothetical protein
MICVAGAEVWLEAMADSPELWVNGRPEKCVRLKDQDRLRIEPFELIVHLPANAAATVQSAVPVATEGDADTAEAGDLSALELVERIDAATELVIAVIGRRRASGP